MGKSDCSYTLSEVWYFYELEKLWKFGVPNRMFQYTCIFTPLTKTAKCSLVVIIVMNKNDDCGMSVEITLISGGRSENEVRMALFVSTDATPIMFIIGELVAERLSSVSMVEEKILTATYLKIIVRWIQL